MILLKIMALYAPQYMEEQKKKIDALNFIEQLDQLTKQKAQTIMERGGYEPVGLILSDGKKRCYVDAAKVVWSDKPFGE